jgi:GAF domain-containing protein
VGLDTNELRIAIEGLADGRARALGWQAPHDLEEGRAGRRGLWFEPRGIVSTVCVPLCAGERRIGVLFFDFDGETTLLQKERSFLTDVGERTARALARRPAYASVVQELPLLQ